MRSSRALSYTLGLRDTGHGHAGDLLLPPAQPLHHIDLLCASVSPLRAKAKMSTLFAWRSASEDH